MIHQSVYAGSVGTPFHMGTDANEAIWSLLLDWNIICR